MKSNFWEELNLSDLAGMHDIHMKRMNLPEWALRIKCPFCKKDLPPRSIRDIGIKFNSRNIGDIFVTVCCESCGKMDTLYFRNEIENITDFGNYLKGITTPKSEPIIEEEMYALKHNNLIEKTLKEIKEIKERVFEYKDVLGKKEE